ncbi:MAG: hypothetical protein HC840_28110 [Leptolyngbyaceae cyanobacterium RM2_2_4]|nr:hypothetical protein [Leptolyngbyaceae cyanobacterium RM2_2_4]
MKIAPSKSDGYETQRKVAPLPMLIETNKKKTQKTLVFKLKVHPTDNNSPVYEFQMDALDGTEDTREVLQWRVNLDKVITGFNITTAEGKDRMIQQLLRGKVLTTYTAGMEHKRRELHNNRQQEAARQARLQANGQAEDAVAAAIRTAMDGVAIPAITEEFITHGIRRVIESLVPHKALQRQKRCMRRYWRKPKDMSVKQYVSNVIHVNEVELPLLPPFNADQSLSEDEIVDMILFGTPSSWIKEMDRQGLNPEDTTLTALVSFLERIEESEGFDPQSTTIAKKSDNKKSKSSDNKMVAGDKHCLFHGPNTHSSNACHTLKKMLEEQKKGSGSGSKPSFASKNKTWKRDDKYGKDKGKKELAAFIKETIKEEMNSFHSKKRKTSDDDESHAEEGEVNQMDFDLSKFNYEDVDVDNLKIDTDDEVSA